ncbi:MAG: histidine phosphatase family protein [Pirellulales bacterium]|nr:histidine phosphatase family protein [Pirellulales bacterium]
MFQVVLIRPAATEYDRQGRIQGVLDIPLSPEGEQEALKLAEELRGQGIERLFYSDCERARQTAEAVARVLGIKPKKLDHMHNLDEGLWQGMLINDVKRKQPKLYRHWQEHPESVCPPEGEPLAEARQRVQEALSRLFRKHHQGVLGLVVPEPLASLVRSYLNRSDLGDLWQAEITHGTWDVIPVEPALLLTGD